MKLKRFCVKCNAILGKNPRKINHGLCRMCYVINFLKKPRPMTETTKKKISQAMKGKPSIWKGKTFPDEMRKKMSISAKKRIRKPHSLETRIKIGVGNSGRIVSVETRKKIHNRMVGNWSGSKNPKWAGGVWDEPYPQEFNERLKEQIRKRDSYRCQECFRHQSELSTKLSIHHIDYNKSNSTPQNLISLCNACHLKTNYQRENWIIYYQKRIGRLM